MVEDEALEQIAENQSRFRQANERIEAAADSMQLVGRVPFVCECPRESCAQVAALTLDEYEAIRQFPRLFFTIPGHQDVALESGAGVVVSEVDDRYVTVEKAGVAGVAGVAGEVAEARYRELSD